MEILEKSLIDVYMPNDLCARCDEAEPLLACSLTLTPSPSSTYKPCRISFCGSECRDSFVGGFKAARELPFDF